MKLCKDCKWFSGSQNPMDGMRNMMAEGYKPSAPPLRCTHEKAITVDYVLGNHNYAHASVMRETAAPCTPSGMLFEEKA